jgi:hypothetical protein
MLCGLFCVLLQMCQVYDSAECCRNVHAEPAWQQAASQACQVRAPTQPAAAGCSAVAVCLVPITVLCCCVLPALQQATAPAQLRILHLQP